MPIKAILNYLSLFVVALLSVPTVAILVTWNTLPGEKLYPIKRNLENMALKIVGDNFKAQTTLRSQFVNRRFNEASTLLAASSSTQGLTELTTEIQNTKVVIVNAEDPEERQKAAQKMITQLTTYQQKLEVQKQTLSPSMSTTPPAQTTIPDQKQFSAPDQSLPEEISPTQPPPQASPWFTPPSQTTFTPQPAKTTTQQPIPVQPSPEFSLPSQVSEPETEVVEEITQTQEELKDVIEELEEIAIQATDESEDSEKKLDKKDQKPSQPEHSFPKNNSPRGKSKNFN